MIQLSEKTLLSTIQFIFSLESVNKWKICNNSSNNNNEEFHIRFGLSCASKVLGYFVTILEKYTIIPSTNSIGVNSDNFISTGLAMGFISLNESTLSASPHSPADRYNNSNNNNNRNLNNNDKNYNLATSVVEILLSLKVIQTILKNNGNINIIQQICDLCPSMLWLIRDDISKCLLLLCNKRK